jgi:biotin transport system substrate-specific component
MQPAGALTLHRRVLADLLPASAVRDVALVVGYAVLVGLLAQIVVPLPFTPVPVTGQTFGVLLGGMALGPRRALAGMVLYVIAGLIGVPWFAGGAGGFGILSTASFGYLIGFVVAAAVLGLLSQQGLDRKPLFALLAMVAGTAIIYFFGVTWLWNSMHITIGTAIRLGLVPFLLGDALKAVLAAGLLPGAWMLVRNH